MFEPTGSTCTRTCTQALAAGRAEEAGTVGGFSALWSGTACGVETIWIVSTVVSKPPIWTQLSWPSITLRRLVDSCRRPLPTCCVVERGSRAAGSDRLFQNEALKQNTSRTRMMAMPMAKSRAP